MNGNELQISRRRFLRLAAIASLLGLTKSATTEIVNKTDIKQVDNNIKPQEIVSLEQTQEPKVRDTVEINKTQELSEQEKNELRRFEILYQKLKELSLPYDDIDPQIRNIPRDFILDFYNLPQIR